MSVFKNNVIQETKQPSTMSFFYNVFVLLCKINNAITSYHLSIYLVVFVFGDRNGR